MPGLSMYDPEDLQNIRSEMGIDDKMIEEYRKTYGKEESDDNKDEQKHEQKVKGPDQQQKAQTMGFFDTVKAAGEDIYGKVKSLLPESEKKTDL